MNNGILLNQQLSDFHMHSTFSPDGQSTLLAMCQRAKDFGLQEIAITEHAEWHPGWRFEFKTDDYFAAIEQCQQQFGLMGLQLHSGVELGNPHQYKKEAMALLNANMFDVRVAALHWLYDLNIHEPVCFKDRDPYQVYRDYFLEMWKMVEQFEFDILAHFDRIFWRGTQLGAPFVADKLEDVVRGVFTAVINHNVALELNTRLLSDEPNWHDGLITMLGWYKELGGRDILINSDAHRTSQIGMNRDIALGLLVEAGFDAELFEADVAMVAA